MSLFGTLIKQGAKFADEAFDASKMQAKQGGDPNPVPGKRPVDMSPDEKKAFLAWQRRERRRNMSPEQLERERDSARRSHQRHLEERKAKQAASREKNKKTKAKKMRERYASEEEVRARAKQAAMERYAAMMQQSPPWRDQEAIDEIYRQATRLTEATGTPYEVDHVIPLQGDLVRGLHHQDNLMIMPRNLNRGKSNLFDLDTVLPPPRKRR